MMDYEGIVRGADRRATQRPQMTGAMSVVAPTTSASGQPSQQQGGQPRPAPAQQMMMGGACYPTPMSMR
jgi:hypothetical protein